MKINQLFVKLTLPKFLGVHFGKQEAVRRKIELL